jgi:hypothetical protein
MYELSTGVLALIWWCYDIRRQQYPWLLYIAINILLIPAISDKQSVCFQELAV